MSTQFTSSNPTNQYPVTRSLGTTLLYRVRVRTDVLDDAPAPQPAHAQQPQRRLYGAEVLSYARRLLLRLPDAPRLAHFLCEFAVVNLAHVQVRQAAAERYVRKV